MPPVALRRIEPTSNYNLLPVAESIPNPTKPASPNPLAEEHPRLLLELAEQTFPHGKIPRPPWIVRPGSPQDVSTDEPVTRRDLALES